MVDCRLAIDIERLRVPPCPEVSRNGTDTHGRPVHCLNESEGEANAHKVRVVDTVLRPLARVAVLAEDSHGAAENGKNDAENAARSRHWKDRIGYCDRDCTPGSYGRRGEGTCFCLGVEDAGVCFGEEDEESRRQKTGNDGSKALSDPLLFWRSA